MDMITEYPPGRVPGDLTILGDTIRTVDNSDLTLLPDGTGITIIGDAGSTSHGLATNDDLFVSSRLEADGVIYADAGIASAQSITLSDNAGLQLGTSVDTRMEFDTAQTVDSLMIGVDITGRMLVLCDKADINTDFGYSARANPTLIIPSNDATTPAKNISLYHNETDGVTESGLGDLLISTPANQTLRLGQPVYDDLRVPLERGALAGGNNPTFTKFKDNGAGSVGVYAYSFAYQAVAGNEEELFFSQQLPHGYKEGTDLKPHIHWSPAVSGAAGQFVKWGLEYTIANVDGTYGNTAIIKSDASGASTATTSGDSTLTAGKGYVTAIGTISGTGVEVSAMLICRVFRNSSHADDTLAQAAFGCEIDFHHQIDTLGSRQEYVK
jgi:hypothetical protein